MYFLSKPVVVNENGEGVKEPEGAPRQIERWNWEINWAAKFYMIDILGYSQIVIKTVEIDGYTYQIKHFTVFINIFSIQAQNTLFSMHFFMNAWMI